jgi:hypothetical protein
MGVWKQFDLFLRIHNDLKPGEDAWDYFLASQRAHLSSEQVDKLIDRDRGAGTQPCPHCGAERGYALRRGRWRCFYCGQGEAAEKQQQDDPKVAKAERALEHERKARSIEFGIQLWNDATPINNTTAAVYLKNRGLDPPPNPDEVLRWHSSCPFGESGRVGCMLALFRDCVTDQITGIHRTRIISATNGTADRMALGRMAGSAIKLWALRDSTKLAAGEGIESVLAAVKLGHAAPPAWAATVANNLSRLPVVPHVNELTILADNDAHRTSEQHAKELRRKWLACGSAAVIRMPTRVGTDFNDLLLERQS